MIHVTHHAVQRYQERVNNLPYREVVAALSGPTFDKAVEIGVPYVKLGTGQRAVIVDGSVVTVLPKDIWLCTLGRELNRNEGE